MNRSLDRVNFIFIDIDHIFPFPDFSFAHGQYNSWFTFSEYEEPVTVRSCRPIHARELATVSCSFKCLRILLHNYSHSSPAFVFLAISLFDFYNKTLCLSKYASLNDQKKKRIGSRRMSSVQVYPVYASSFCFHIFGALRI